MKRVGIALFCVTALCSVAEAAPYVDDTVKDQWFTGPLVAPSPALPKAGIFAIEPYAIFAGGSGEFDGNSQHHSVSNDTDQFESATLMKYGITDRISVQAIALLGYSWTDQTTSHGVEPGDLPVEIEYRVNNGSRSTGLPSVTFNLGITLPIGRYDRLHSALDGLGNGAYTAKEGVVLQSLFDTWGNHPMRLRLYASAFEPAGAVSLHGVSVYGTDQGFEGNAMPGFSTTGGLGVEYGLDQRWVLAFDVVQNYANGTHLRGDDGGHLFVPTNGVGSNSTALAPAIEFNWSSTLGLVAGVEFVAAGRNTSSYVAPQLGLSMAF